jgi:hypothetical protein
MAEPASTQVRQSTKPKVIYVLGAHRSGSTILGVTLGNCAGVFFAGELHSWQSRRGVPSFGGEAGARLWAEVLEHVGDAADLFGDDTQLYVDRSSALYRIHKWPQRRRLRRAYRRVGEELYRAIAQVTGATHIVDTSHYPLRARELQSLDGIDLYILFLVRDPQGIVASQGPDNNPGYSKAPLVANLQLWVTYLLSVNVFLRHPREQRMLVRHEDFLEDPEGLLRQILDRTGSSAAIPDLTSLRAGSPLQGNRFLQREDVIALRRREPTRTPDRWSAMTRVLQVPWGPILSRLRPAVEPSTLDSGV